MNFYLQKYGFRPPGIQSPPDPNLGIIVVIPCFDEPDILPTLKSLYRADMPVCAVEVIIVVNSGTHHSEEIKNRNLETIDSIRSQDEFVLSGKLTYHIISINDMPKKHAGVGLARKIGMDEAVARFDNLNRDGIIVCFDADSICCYNYLTEIEQHFTKHPKTPGCAIRYEHPVSGQEFSKDVYDGIINYELFLRYYNQGLHFAGLPYAFHTVGSSMAVRSSAYQKQGGMNKRKAGEDFYFLHKIIALGGFTELNSTKVIPSPRTSDRVPFGTGKAINDWIEGESTEYMTYDFRIWELLKAFVECIPDLQNIAFIETDFYKLPSAETFIQFLNDSDFESGLNEIRNNSTDKPSFLKRFFVWFSAFRVLKLVHFLRDEQWPNQPLFDQAVKMSKVRGFYKGETDLKTLLISYRNKENQTS